MSNKRQRDGLAKVLDTVGSGLLIALGIDLIVKQTLDWPQAATLVILGVVSVVLAYLLQKGD